MAAPAPSREVLFEVTRIGNVVKVSAMDSDTATEVTLQGAATTSLAVLKAAAAQKLLYVLKKKASAG